MSINNINNNTTNNNNNNNNATTSNMENYRKIEIVGKGSFGYAVLVQSVIDRKYYIMKIIDVSKMDRKQKEEALNEVNFLKEMRHPFIVTYRESFMDKNRYLCIVMDYADGGDMYTKIAQQKKLGKGFSESQILDWFVQICLALKYVHGKKILHRDLKTQNIFLTAKGVIKIGDFGIARVLQNTYDCAQTAIGTPYYLSPEICQEKPYNQKSDIWSLGCILYELVTLRHAFDANSMKGLVLKILRGSYPAIPSTFSQELRDLIAEMLTKDPKSRPSVKKLLEKDILAQRIGPLLTNTLAKHDLGNTILKKVNQYNQQQENHTGQILSSIMPSNGNAILSNNNNQPQMAMITPKLSQGLDHLPSQPQQPRENIVSNAGGGSFFNEKVPTNLINPPNTLNNNSNIQQQSVQKVKMFNNEEDKKIYQSNVIQQQQQQIQKKTTTTTTTNSNHNARISQDFTNVDQSNISNTNNSNNTGIDTSITTDKKRSSSSRTSNNPSMVVDNNNAFLKSYIDEEAKIQDLSKQTFNGKSPSPIQKNHKKENNEKLNNFINSVQEYLEPEKSTQSKPQSKYEEDSDEEDNFQEEDDKRVYARFLTVEGKELPGCTDKDSISYRIEALKVYLENQLTPDIFYSVYKYLINTYNDDDIEQNKDLLKLIGNKNEKFLPLIYQMIVCEESYYGGTNN